MSNNGLEHNAETEVRERPVAFNAAMIKAILSGSKFCTRRTSRIPQDAFDVDYDPAHKKWAFPVKASGKTLYRQCPYGVPGDRLWVKESWAAGKYYDDVKPAIIESDSRIYYPSTSDFIGEWYLPDDIAGKLRPPMFMPRCFSRILLEVTSVNCERLQAITHKEAIEEGLVRTGRQLGRMPYYRDYQGYVNGGYLSPTLSFASLWDSISGQKEGKCWDDNPWVWNVGFRVLEVRV